ncbi:MAG: methyltransferase domain-containing protein [Gammaproteobacteria bacterium]|nr:methyltransferase domain-containing protein [Gammaproteobacteria bacterium]
MSGDDRWARLEDDEAVRAAAERLDQFSSFPSEKLARERYLASLDPGPGDRVLEVGAGTGDISLDIARRVAPDGAVTALDPSAGLLRHAREHARRDGLEDRIETVVGDARALPWTEARFDRAFDHWVLLHVDSPAAVIEELKRVVRPGGRIVCVEVDWETLVVHPGDPRVTRRVVRANVERQLDGRMGRQLASLLRGCGFSDVEVVPIVDVESEAASPGWLEFLETRIPVAEEAGVSRRALEKWWGGIRAAAARGDYFFSLTQFAVSASVPAHS